MANIVATMDSFNPLWESKELNEMIKNGFNDKAVQWLKTNCGCAETNADDVELMCDGTVLECDGYKLLYSDYGFLERIDLIK